MKDEVEEVAAHPRQRGGKSGGSAAEEWRKEEEEEEVAWRHTSLATRWVRRGFEGCPPPLAFPLNLSEPGNSSVALWQAGGPRKSRRTGPYR